MASARIPLDVRQAAGAAYEAFGREQVDGVVREWIEFQLVGEPALLTRSREAYVAHHLARSLAAIELVPQRSERGQLLELGSGIYLMTFLVERLRNYELELVQHWGRPPGRYVSPLVNQRTGERREMAFREFNGEVEPFPYADESFDVILNCEHHRACAVQSGAHAGRVSSRVEAGRSDGADHAQCDPAG